MSTPPSPSRIDALRDWFRSIPARGWVHLLVLITCMIGAIVHQRVGGLYRWYIEDAAISFAYARHLAQGEGLVPFAGGERVEGYSNALWVFMLAPGEYVGISGFESSKVLAVLFAGMCVPMVYEIARFALPHHREDSEAPLLAPIALVLYSCFSIWNTSGLENALFNVLLTGAVLRALIEARDGGLPWSALLWFLLTMTRPEGIMYAAIGGFWTMVFQFHAGRGVVPTLKWLGLFWIPWAAYNFWRYQYFAWFFQNTYYAKDRNPDHWNWNHQTWKYVRNWAYHLWTGFFLPFVFYGALGTRKWRGWLASALVVLVAIVYTYPSNGLLNELTWWPDLPAPDWWGKVRVGTALMLALFLPLPAIGARGWQARVLCLSCGSAGIFFSVYAGADWMKGWRWMSMVSMPYAVLLPVGVVELSDWVQRRFTESEAWKTPGWLAFVVLGGVLVPPNVMYTNNWVKKKETGPYSVKKRVEYMNAVRTRLHLDERPVVWDVDQGAHLYWSDFWMMDMAGLIDVTMAHHQTFEKPFMREYMFEEMKPHFAHVHGGWASRSKIPSMAEWRRDYIEIPGFPAGKNAFHIGNHIRRDLFLEEGWSGPADRQVPFEGGITLKGWDVPSPEAGKGRWWYLELGLHSTEQVDFRVIAFLSTPEGEVVASWELPPAYDYVMPSEWSIKEVFHGRFSLRLRKELPEGTYDLGFVMMDKNTVYAATNHRDGTVLLPEVTLSEQAVVDAPRYAVGEVRFPAALQIVDIDARAKAAKADRKQAIEHASEGNCEAAERSWLLSRAHRPRNDKYAKQFGPLVRSALAQCWVQRAKDDPERVVDHLDRARVADHRNPAYLAAARPVADRLYIEGVAAMNIQDWESAYRKFTDCLRVDKQRSWARRYAEEVRNHRLGLDPEAQAQAFRDRQERMKRLRDKRKQAQKERRERAKMKAKQLQIREVPDDEGDE